MTKPFLAAVVLIALCAVLILGAKKKLILPNSAESTSGWNIGIRTDSTLVPGMCSEISADKNRTIFHAEADQSLNSIHAVFKEA